MHILSYHILKGSIILPTSLLISILYFFTNVEQLTTTHEGRTDNISPDPRGRTNAHGDEDDGNLSSNSASSMEDQDGKESKIRTLRSHVSFLNFCLIL